MLSDQLGHIIHTQLCSEQLVVLPSFGGFVMDNVPSELDELRNHIQPPGKTVLFNAKLVHNDGLLIAAIAQEQKLSYATADTWLTDAISELRFRLENRETINWTGIGTLKKSISGQIEFGFDGDAALQGDTFGLKPLSLQIAEKDNVDKVREMVAADGPVATAVRTIPLKRITRYAAAAVAVGFLLWIPMQTGVMQHGKTLVHQLNPFVISMETAYTPRNFNEDWLSKGLENPDALADRFQQEYLSINLTENPTNSIVVKTDAIPSNEVEIVEEVASEPISKTASTYQVIAATFNTKAKAADYVADMIKRGFGAQYAGKDESGHLVAYGAYDSLEDANKMLASVSLSNKKAWIVAGS